MQGSKYGQLGNFTNYSMDGIVAIYPSHQLLNRNDKSSGFLLPM